MQDQEQSRPEVQTPDPANELLTIQQVAKELQLADNKIRHWVNSGELRAFRPNRQLIRIPRTALQEFLSSHTGGEFGQWATR